MSVELPGTIKSIGHRAFGHCSNLTTTITIPPSVKSIERCAFAYCTSLISVAIPDSDVEIEACVFGSCYNLQSCCRGGEYNALFAVIQFGAIVEDFPMVVDDMGGSSHRFVI